MLSIDLDELQPIDQRAHTHADGLQSLLSSPAPRFPRNWWSLAPIQTRGMYVITIAELAVSSRHSILNDCKRIKCDRLEAVRWQIEHRHQYRHRIDRDGG